jgi:uncharacterized protein with GYD domain
MIMIRMEKALILLKIECLGEDCIEEVLGRVKQRPEVKEAGMTFGEFDVYLIAEVAKSLEMTKLVMELRGYPSVVSTTTLLIVG